MLRPARPSLPPLPHSRLSPPGQAQSLSAQAFARRARASGVGDEGGSASLGGSRLSMSALRVPAARSPSRSPSPPRGSASYVVNAPVFDGGGVGGSSASVSAGALHAASVRRAVSGAHEAAAMARRAAGGR